MWRGPTDWPDLDGIGPGATPQIYFLTLYKDEWLPRHKGDISYERRTKPRSSSLGGNLPPLRIERIYLAIEQISTRDLDKHHSDTGFPRTINQ